jgi:hypothetical protein
MLPTRLPGKGFSPPESDVRDNPLAYPFTQCAVAYFQPPRCLAHRPDHVRDLGSSLRIACCKHCLPPLVVLRPLHLTPQKIRSIKTTILRNSLRAQHLEKTRKFGKSSENLRGLQTSGKLREIFGISSVHSAPNLTIGTNPQNRNAAPERFGLTGVPDRSNFRRADAS